MKALSQPLFASLRGYDRQQLGPDLFSGVLIALLSIPSWRVCRRSTACTGR